MYYDVLVLFWLYFVLPLVHDHFQEIEDETIDTMYDASTMYYRYQVIHIEHCRIRNCTFGLLMSKSLNYQ